MQQSPKRDGSGSRSASLYANALVSPILLVYDLDTNGFEGVEVGAVGVAEGESTLFEAPAGCHTTMMPWQSGPTNRQ